MLIIQWLKCLPQREGIVVIRRTVTNCYSLGEVDAEARLLWPHSGVPNAGRPDGFQVVDQDGCLICAARYNADNASFA